MQSLQFIAKYAVTVFCQYSCFCCHIWYCLVLLAAG